MSTQPPSSTIPEQNTCTALILHPFARSESAKLSAEQIEELLTFIKNAARSTKLDLSKSRDKFTLFLNLPTELRRLILRKAADMLPTRYVFKRTYLSHPRLRFGVDMRLYDPPLIHVNRESRDVTLQVYQTSFKSIKHTEIGKVIVSQLCFNLKTDALLGFGISVGGF